MQLGGNKLDKHFKHQYFYSEMYAYKNRISLHVCPLFSDTTSFPIVISHSFNITIVVSRGYDICTKNL